MMITTFVGGLFRSDTGWIQVAADWTANYEISAGW